MDEKTIASLVAKLDGSGSEEEWAAAKRLRTLGSRASRRIPREQLLPRELHLFEDHVMVVPFSGGAFHTPGGSTTAMPRRTPPRGPNASTSADDAVRAQNVLVEEMRSQMKLLERQLDDSSQAIRRDIADLTTAVVQLRHDFDTGNPAAASCHVM